LEAGEIDIMPDVAWNQQRSQVYRFTETKVLVSWSRLYAKKDSGIETILDLDGKTVAGLKGSVNYDGAEGIKDLVQRFDVNVTFMDLNSYTEVFEAIQNGTVDAGITNKDFGNKNERNYSNLERTAFVFQPAYITFAFPRDGALTPQLIEAIDSELRVFKADNDSIYYQSLGRYLEEEAAATETVISSIPVWVKDTGLIGGGLVLFFFLTSVIARREVRRKTVELEREIQERKQAQLELESSEKYFRALTENSSDGIGVISEHGMVVYQSPASFRILGFTLEELTSQDVFKFVHPDDQGKSLGLFAQLIENPGISVATQIRYRHKDGTWRWMETVGTNLLADASVHGIVVNFRDITEGKHVNDALRELQERQQSILDTMFVFVGLFSLDGLVLEANRAPLEAAGLKLEDVIGKPFADLPPWDHSSTTQTQIREGIRRAAQGESVREDLLLRLPNHQFITIDTIFVPLRDSSGRIIQVVGSGVDITARKQAELALQAAEQDYRAIFENAPIGIFQSTPEGRYLKVNSTTATMYGYASPDEMLRSISNIARQIYIEDAARQEFQKLLNEHGEVVEYENQNLRKDGSLIWTSTNARAVRDDSNRIIYYEGFIRDITERKQSEAERDNLIAELSAKNTELEHFIYTVSHDLKAPLVTMKGFLGYLEQDAVSGNVERIKGDTHRISNAVEKMQGLLGDLLELSRIGRFINPPVKIPFAELASEAISLVEGQIQERGVRVELQPDMPAVYGDKLRLLEVLQNLLDNAVKYMGDQAHPHIEIGNHKKDADSDLSIFFVKDNGMGIAPEYQEKVFGLFNKLDARSEGTGVGLALVKRIIEMHGGRVWIESELEQGSVFYFTLPTAQH